MINSQGLLKSRWAFAPVLVCAGLALAACGSSGSSAPSASAAPSTVSPSWQSALGSGTVVYAPKPETPGHGNPGQVVAGVFAAVTSKNLADECNYIDPGQTSACKSQAAQAQAAAGKNLPYVKNGGIGYVVVDGTKALVGTTGTFCDPTQTPACYTNTDPAAIFSAGNKTFSQLWTAAVKTNTSNEYALAPTYKVNGKWYLYSGS